MSKEPNNSDYLRNVCLTLKNDFKARKLTYRDVALEVGMSPKSFNNQMMGKLPFSNKLIQNLVNHFGYNPNFLISGTGHLYPVYNPFNHSDGTPPNVYNDMQRLGFEMEALGAAEKLLNILNNKLAIEAFHAISNDEHEKYKMLLQRLKDDFGYYDNLYGSLTPIGRVQWQKNREAYTKIEVEHAMHLAELENILDSNNGTKQDIDIDFEVNRFKEKLLLLVRAYNPEQYERETKMKSTL